MPWSHTGEEGSSRPTLRSCSVSAPGRILFWRCLLALSALASFKRSTYLFNVIAEIVFINCCLLIWHVQRPSLTTACERPPPLAIVVLDSYSTTSWVFQENTVLTVRQDG